MLHPSQHLDPDQVVLIRRSASAAETLGRLTPEVLALAHEAGWFTMLAPAAYGGHALALPEVVALEEALSWADGSTGWVVTLCSGAGWFGGFLEPALARTIFATSGVCLAGSGAPGGTAEICGDTYLLDGEWNYASGALDATHFTANCVVTRGGAVVRAEGGEPCIVPFVIDRGDVEVLTTWRGMGMVATGSHAFRAKDLTVGRERAFKIDAAHARIDDPLYRYPFQQLAEATLAANLSGMAVHFLDLCESLLQEAANRTRLSEEVRCVLVRSHRSAADNLRAARHAFHEAVAASWSKFFDDRSASLAVVSVTSRTLVRAARHAIDDLYPFCGMRAASTDTDINRVWRDFHTAGQHALFVRF